MSETLRFPDPMDEMRRRGEEFQRLPAEERWRDMAAMSAFGWQLVRSSPNRAAIEQKMNEDELHSQQIQRAIIERHGRATRD